jgi:hypothetical protein
MNQWNSYITFPENENVTQFEKQRNKQLHVEQTQILPKERWTGNNCVVNFSDWSDEGNPVEYVKQIYEMIYKTTLYFKNKGGVPDCDLLINRKDFLYLHSNPKRYAYTALFPENVEIPNPPKKYWIIGSQCTSNENKDVPIPTAPEWKEYHFSNQIKNRNQNNQNNQNENSNHSWKKKDSKVFFRGQSTGCGLTEANNPRIRFSLMSHLSNKHIMDIGITKFVKKVKVNNFIYGFIDKYKYKDLIKDFVSHEEQAKYKYILNIEGNVAAYRFGGEFKHRNSVIMKAESSYLLWFEPFLKNHQDYLLIPKSVYHLEGDNIDKSLQKTEEFLEEKMEDDKKMYEIQKNGRKFGKKYLTERNIYEYWFCFMLKNNEYST